MKYKNELEEKVYLIAKEICGEGVEIKHNKVITIEDSSDIATASFDGPPKKEVDLITAKLGVEANVVLLISCKQYAKNVPPLAVQEWVSVVNTMNKYSKETKYIGMVFSSTGFSNGSEAWATTNNISLVPPLKGTQIKIDEELALKLFKRALIGIVNRFKFPYENLLKAPQFYDFTYRLTADFETYNEITKDGIRYKISGENWVSDFSEMAQLLKGKEIKEILNTADGISIIMSEDVFVSVEKNGVIFGNRKDLEIHMSELIEPTCRKNIFYKNNDCDFNYIKKKVIGKKITSLADWQTHLEFGINRELNFGFEPNKVYVNIFQNND